LFIPPEASKDFAVHDLAVSFEASLAPPSELLYVALNDSVAEVFFLDITLAYLTLLSPLTSTSDLLLLLNLDTPDFEFTNDEFELESRVLEPPPDESADDNDEPSLPSGEKDLPVLFPDAIPAADDTEDFDDEASVSSSKLTSSLISEPLLRTALLFSPVKKYLSFWTSENLSILLKLDSRLAIFTPESLDPSILRKKYEPAPIKRKKRISSKKLYLVNLLTGSLFKDTINPAFFLSLLSLSITPS
jgi:hypothetical protein